MKRQWNEWQPMPMPPYYETVGMFAWICFPMLMRGSMPKPNAS